MAETTGLWYSFFFTTSPLAIVAIYDSSLLVLIPNYYDLNWSGFLTWWDGLNLHLWGLWPSQGTPPCYTHSFLPRCLIAVLSPWHHHLWKQTLKPTLTCSPKGHRSPNLPSGCLSLQFKESNLYIKAFISKLTAASHRERKHIFPIDSLKKKIVTDTSSFSLRFSSPHVGYGKKPKTHTYTSYKPAPKSHHVWSPS